MRNQSRWITILFLLIFLSLAGLAVRAYFSRYPELTSENLDRFIRSFGAWAVAAYFVAYLLSSPIPFIAPLLAATGGLLFGPWLGAVASVTSGTVTSLIPFMISRRLGREWVEGKMKGTRLEDIIVKVGGGSGFKFILLLRLVPILPWELQNYIAGVSRVTLPSYLLATLLGSSPLSLALVLLGAAAKNPASWQFPAAILLTAVILLAPIIYVAIRNRKRQKAV